jgi:hypothetical protein
LKLSGWVMIWSGFTADVFASLTRSGWQDPAGWYVQGLMLDGRP